MLQQQDRQKHTSAMKVEAKAMFDNDIWKRVHRRDMKQHYDKQWSPGKSVKREQLQLIWYFKQERKPDGSLDKYKARLCCHGR